MISGDEYNYVIDKTVPSEEMKNFYKSDAVNLSIWELAELVRNSPEITLKGKYILLWFLSEKAEDETANEIKTIADDFKSAIEEANDSEGNIFLVSSPYFDEDINDYRKGNTKPFNSFYKAVEYIKYNQKLEEFDDQSLCWHEIEKWSPDKSGNLEHKITYYHIFGKGICFFSLFKKSEEGYFICDYNHVNVEGISDLNLPVPFKTGDIVRIDSTPFVPPVTGLIVYAGEQWDCCSPIVLYRDNDGTFKTGALKHGDMWLRLSYWPKYSPLYNLRLCKDKLKDGEEIYKDISKLIRRDNKKGEMVLDLVDKNRFSSPADLLNAVQ